MYTKKRKIAYNYQVDVSLNQKKRGGEIRREKETRQ